MLIENLYNFSDIEEELHEENLDENPPPEAFSPGKLKQKGKYQLNNLKKIHDIFYFLEYEHMYSPVTQEEQEGVRREEEEEDREEVREEEQEEEEEEGEVREADQEEEIIRESPPAGI